VADKDGFRPLIIAAMGGHLESVNWLLANGADWRLTSKSGKNALWWAEKMGEKGVATVLTKWAEEHP
jgi:ankyrin repeat protein